MMASFLHIDGSEPGARFVPYMPLSDPSRVVTAAHGIHCRQKYVPINWHDA